MYIVLGAVQFHSFACGHAVFPALFVEKTVLSPLHGLGTLDKKALTKKKQNKAKKTFDYTYKGLFLKTY